MRLFLLWLTLSTGAVCQYSGLPIMGTTSAGATTTSCGSATGYTNTITITIAAQTGQAGDLTSVPLIFGGDSHLAATGSGGFSQSTGTDVVFCTKNDGTGSIISYIKVPNTYVSTTGLGKWLVLAPTISHTTTSVIYALVGKSSASDFSCGPSGSNNCGSTILSGYLGVIEFGSASTLDLTDWTLINTTTNHSVAAVAGPIFGGGTFGGANFLDSGGHQNLAASNSGLSVEAWVNLSDTASVQFIASNTGTLSNGGFEFYVFSTGFTCGIGGSGTTSEYRFSSGGLTGAWTFAACTWNGSDGKVTANWKEYLNAVSKTLSVVAAGSTGYTNSSTNALYGEQPGGNFKISGNMADLRVHQGGLSADQILWDYNNGLSPGSTYTVTTP